MFKKLLKALSRENNTTQSVTPESEREKDSGAFEDVFKKYLDDTDDEKIQSPTMQSVFLQEAQVLIYETILTLKAWKKEPDDEHYLEQTFKNLKALETAAESINFLNIESLAQNIQAYINESIREDVLADRAFFLGVERQLKALNSAVHQQSKKYSVDIIVGSIEHEENSLDKSNQKHSLNQQYSAANAAQQEDQDKLLNESKKPSILSGASSDEADDDVLSELGYSESDESATVPNNSLTQENTQQDSHSPKQDQPQKKKQARAYESNLVTDNEISDSKNDDLDAVKLTDQSANKVEDTVNSDENRNKTQTSKRAEDDNASSKRTKNGSQLENKSERRDKLLNQKIQRHIAEQIKYQVAKQLEAKLNQAALLNLQKVDNNQKSWGDTSFNHISSSQETVDSTDFENDVNIETVTFENSEQEKYNFFSSNLHKLQSNLQQKNTDSSESDEPIGDIQIMFSDFIPEIESLHSFFTKKLNKSIELKISGADIVMHEALANKVSVIVMHLLRYIIQQNIEGSAQRFNYKKPSRASISLKVDSAEHVIFLVLEDDGQGIDFLSAYQDAYESERLTKDQLKKNIQQLNENHNEESLSADELKVSSQAIIDFVLKQEQIKNLDLEKYEVQSEQEVGLGFTLSEIESLGGQVNIFSRQNMGARYEITLPDVPEKMQVLKIVESGFNYALPLRNIVKVMPERDLQLNASYRDDAQPQFDYEGLSYLCFSLKNILFDEDAKSVEQTKAQQKIVLLNTLHENYALLVDDIGDVGVVTLRNVAENLEKNSQILAFADDESLAVEENTESQILTILNPANLLESNRVTTGFVQIYKSLNKINVELNEGYQDKKQDSLREKIKLDLERIALSNEELSAAHNVNEVTTDIALEVDDENKQPGVDDDKFFKQEAGQEAANLEVQLDTEALDENFDDSQQQDLSSPIKSVASLKLKSLLESASAQHNELLNVQKNQAHTLKNKNINVEAKAPKSQQGVEINQNDEALVEGTSDQIPDATQSNIDAGNSNSEAEINPHGAVTIIFDDEDEAVQSSALSNTKVDSAHLNTKHTASNSVSANASKKRYSSSIKEDMRVLMIDCEQQDADSFKAYLEANDCPQWGVIHSEDPLNYLKSNTVDVVILSSVGKQAVNLDVLNALRKDALLRRQPVIVATTLSSDVYKQRAFLLGANYILQRPYSHEQLREVVEVVSQQVTVVEQLHNIT